MKVVPAVTLEQLNLLFDSELRAVAKAEKLPEAARQTLTLYIESLQNRINRTAFDLMAKRAENPDG